MSRFIKEDSTIFNVQRQQMGQKKNEDLPKPNKVSDMIDQNENQVAPQPKPYPLDRFDDIVTDVFVGVLNLRKLIETARNNPEVEKKHKDKLLAMNNKLEEIGKTLVEVSNIIDTIN